MILNSIIGSIMNMSADIYIQQGTQTTSGTIARQWVYHRTIPCKIEPVAMGTSIDRADNKAFDVGRENSYVERIQLKMKSPELLSRRWRIGSIRDNAGDVVYKEIDIYGQPDTMFDITACRAELDPLGRISYYETTLQRVMVQDNDTVADK